LHESKRIEHKGKEPNMKRILLAIAITMIAVTAAQAADVAASVSIGQPGFYGSFAIGGYPAPAVVYASPVVVRPAPVVVYRPAPVVVARPVYAYVPPGHAKHWYRDHRGYPVYYRHDGRYYR
jgi:hypothetical protein